MLGVGGIAPRILHLETRCGELSASLSGRSTPKETASSNQWIGGWVSTRAGLNVI